ncbi:MAG: hypothetical protein OXU25_05200 [Thaumarchaeota archaeon]|nr:hypothetical protein [Nitrososphaerota archaeon]
MSPSLMRNRCDGSHILHMVGSTGSSPERHHGWTWQSQCGKRRSSAAGRAVRSACE